MPIPELSMVSADGTWVVRAEGAVIGESRRAVEVVERDGVPGVIYFPRDDLGMAFLEGSGGVASHSFGEASLFNIVTASGVILDVAWSYEAPRPGAERIAGLIAFDATRVAVEAV